ncbi:MAG: hypothetical protein ABIP51_22575 [Bacteroidia bacterium]
MRLKKQKVYLLDENTDQFTSPNTIIHTKKEDEFVRLEENNGVFIELDRVFELFSNIWDAGANAIPDKPTKAEFINSLFND